MNGNMRRIWTSLALFLVVFEMAGCKGNGSTPSAGGPGAPGKPGAMGGPAMAFAVETAPVVSEPVGFSTTAVGSVSAFEQVLITARVAGAVDRVRFQEGDTVTAGQVLAEIETDRYALAVRARGRTRRAGRRTGSDRTHSPAGSSAGPPCGASRSCRRAE